LHLHGFTHTFTFAVAKKTQIQIQLLGPELCPVRIQGQPCLFPLVPSDGIPETPL
jgi:hypothetical protein